LRFYIYLALTQHLSRTSIFPESRQAVIFAARSLFRSVLTAVHTIKLQTIADAFDAVSINLEVVGASIPLSFRQGMNGAGL